MSFKITKSNVPRSYAARTDVGKVREHNEDSYLLKSPLFVVADGMGGHEAGEVASKIAVDTMEAEGPKSTSPEALAKSVLKANEAIIEGAKNGTGKPGMGTTITAAFVYGDNVVIAQVGDSRAYLLHEGELQRITRDHSLVADLIEQGRLTEAEARFHPQRSVITRALGSDPNMQPDLYTLKVTEGDRLMLCSDGLSSMITDDAIETLLKTEATPKEACDALVEEALDAGGLDNVSVIVIDPLGEPEQEKDEVVYVEERAAKPTEASIPRIDAEPKAGEKKDSKPKHSKKKQKGRFAPVIWALAFILILAAVGLGFYAYTQNSYYVIEESGTVNVYRGLPGDIAGIKMSWLEAQAPDVDVTKLAPSTQSKLAEGIPVDSLDEANNLISEYRQTNNQDR